MIIVDDNGKAFSTNFQACECGRPQLIVAEPGLRDDFAYAADFVDVFFCQDERGICSGCGCEVILPVPEALDLDRDEYGLYVQEMVADIQTERKRPDYEPPEGDIPF